MKYLVSLIIILFSITAFSQAVTKRPPVIADSLSGFDPSSGGGGAADSSLWKLDGSDIVTKTSGEVNVTGSFRLSTVNQRLGFGAFTDNDYFIKTAAGSVYCRLAGGNVMRWRTVGVYVNHLMPLSPSVSDIGGPSTPFDIGYIDSLEISGGVNINETLKQSNKTIADNDATPAVGSGNIFTYAGSANSVVVTDLDSPTAGVIYTIIGNSDTYTISVNDGGNFSLAGGVNFTMGLNDVLVLYCVADNNYIEISRSDN